jgi:glycosyltransferase involved in cell wall biosynthesis
MKHLLLGVLLFVGSLCYALPQKHIVVVTASYNNKEWYKQNLESVFLQDYTNWELIYVDDCSPDGTGNLVQDYVNERCFNDKVTVIKNHERKGALANQHAAIHGCDDKSIIIILDGDDFFANALVFKFINEIYSQFDIWLTYGQFKHLSNGVIGFCSPMPRYVIQNNLFRQYSHIPSHLRTFYAGLFKKIRVSDLMLDGKFYPMTGDMAAMIPMIEMARKGHFAFVSEVLLVYNDMNSLNDHKVSQQTQRKIDKHIRSLPRYVALDAL